MNVRYFFVVGFFLVTSLQLFAVPALAQFDFETGSTPQNPQGIVNSEKDVIPCGTTRNPAPCKPCHIVVMGIRLINFAMKFLALPIALVMITYAGFVYITSFGRPARITAANTILKNTLFGILIVYGAFFAVDISIKVLTGDLQARGFKALGAWNDPFQAHPELAKCANIILPPAQTVDKGDLNTASAKITKAIERIANIIAIILFLISPLMILYAAWLYMTSGGDPKQTEQAKNVLIFALVAIFVALLAYAVPTMVIRLFNGPEQGFEWRDIF